MILREIGDCCTVCDELELELLMEETSWDEEEEGIWDVESPFVESPVPEFVAASIGAGVGIEVA